MKRSILSLAVIALMAGTISTSFGQKIENHSVKNQENVKEARKNVVDAKNDLKEAQKESEKDFQKFKKESDQKIRGNERSIAALKLKLSKIHSKETIGYRKDLKALEQKNSKMKKELANYKVKDNDKWTSFKREFIHDMDELGQSLKDFTVKNTK